MVPAFFGTFNNNSRGKNFIGDYNDKGYITGQSIDFCSREVFDIDNGGAITGMKWYNYDHEMVTLFCDSNYTPYDQPLPIMIGSNSIRKRCLYNKNVTDYSLEYGWQFFTKYKDEAKFFKVGIFEGHEGSTEVIKYSDDVIVEFFEKFRAAGYLDDTFVFIQTDHGNAMTGPYSLMDFEDYNHELVLPAFFTILPSSFKNYDEVRENLKHNEQSLVNPFNIYNSLLVILNDSEIKYASQDNLDIFNTKLYYSRNCDTFHNKGYYRNTEYLCRCTK